MTALPKSLTIVAGALLAAACGGDSPVDPTQTPAAPDAPVATVVVSPATDTLTSIGQELQLSAIARDEQGATIPQKPFTWQSSDETVVTVDPSGRATAVGNGAAVVSATADGVADSTSLQVAQVAAQLLFTGQPTDMEVGSGFAGTIALEVVDSLGTRVSGATPAVSLRLDGDTSGATLTGQTTVVGENGAASFPGLDVTMAGRGLAIAASADSLPVVVSTAFDALSGLAAHTIHLPARGVTVSGIGASRTVDIQAEDEHGDPTWPPSARLSSRDPRIAVASRVDRTTGRITARRVGQVSIIVEAGGWADELLATVVEPDPAGPVTWEWGDINTNILNDVWATGPEDVWAVGHSGTILHYDGVAWSDVSPGLTREDLTTVWASGPDDVWVAAYPGELLHFDGGSWTTVVPREGAGVQSIRAIWGSDPDDLWAVGYAKDSRQGIFHYDGTRWSSSLGDAGTLNKTLFSVWGFATDDVWAGGSGGALLRYDGEQWTEAGPPGLTSTVRDLFGSAPDDMWMLAGSTPWHWDGHGWTERSAGLPADMRSVRAGWSSGPTDAWLVSHAGWAGWHFDGSTWTRDHLPSSVHGNNAMHGSGSRDVWVVGSWGQIRHFDGRWWTELPSRVTGETPSAIWGSADNDIWATTRVGGMLHFDGRSWSPTGDLRLSLLHGLWGSSRHDIWAVGERGATARYDGRSWAPVSQSVTSGKLEDVWGSRPDDVWAVSDDGTIIHWDGTGWSEVETSVSVTQLKGVWGTSDSDVWFVGDRGFIGVVLHYDGVSVTERAPTWFSTSFNDVWGTGPEDVWVVGERGALLHWNGSAWVQTIQNPDELVSYEKVWGTGPADIWALGGYGGCCPRFAYTLRHFDGAFWADATPGRVTWNSLSAIWGTREGPLWAWGTFGTLLRGTR